jgi:ribosome-associated protein
LGGKAVYEIVAALLLSCAPSDVAGVPNSSVAAMQVIPFDLEGEFVELNQLLKLVGLCDSGGAGKAMVASGVVSVDGQIESRKTCKIRAGQKVHIGDACIEVRAAG